VNGQVSGSRKLAEEVGVNYTRFYWKMLIDHCV
jgi:hypothetical protein